MSELNNQIARRLGGKPPDLDGMNGTRSDWAGNAIEKFEADTRVDREDALSDLLANLMHWCDRNEQCFDNELRRGRNHYLAETAEEFS
ncbi:MAG: hypothetical protein HQ445_09085 [Polaromonas sp.]|nr:hypothetical protein [Polaromonas sp.]